MARLFEASPAPEPSMRSQAPLLLAQLEKAKLGKTGRPRRARAAKTGAVRRAARREVYERDAERCAFVDETGRSLCTAC